MNKKELIVVSALLLSLNGCAEYVENILPTQNRTVIGSPNSNLKTAIAVVSTTKEKLSYDVVNNLAVYKGDIILGTHAEVQANGVKSLPVSIKSQSVCSDDLPCTIIATNNHNTLWSGGVIPYSFTAGTSPTRKGWARVAMTEWESLSNILFVQRTNEQNYIEFDSISHALPAKEISQPVDLLYTNTLFDNLEYIDNDWASNE